MRGCEQGELNEFAMAQAKTTGEEILLAVVGSDDSRGRGRNFYVFPGVFVSVTRLRASLGGGRVIQLILSFRARRERMRHPA
jgi:hypothetical protein